MKLSFPKFLTLFNSILETNYALVKAFQNFCFLMFQLSKTRIDLYFRWISSKFEKEH